MGINDLKLTRVYQAQGPLLGILSGLAEVRRMDAHYEKLERTFRNLAIWAFVAIPVLLVLQAVQLGHLGNVLLLLLLLLDIVFAFVALWYKRHFRQWNFENRRYELVSKVIGLIRRDVAPDAPLSIRLDLQPADDKSKLQAERKAGIWKIKTYADPWLSLSGKMMDHTGFHLSAVEKIDRRKGWKKSSSGKYKAKSKERHTTVLTLALRVKAGRYPGLPALVKDRSNAPRVNALVKSFECAADALTLKVVSPERWDERSGPKLLATMFLSLYQVLRRARAAGKRGAGSVGVVAGA